MPKPSPIAIIALCIAAFAILAFTINEEFGKKRRSSTKGPIVAKNTNIISPIEATNPPHGKPGHRHDLPDGAPLPANTAMPPNTSPSTTGLPLNNTAQTANEAGATNLNPAHGQPGHKCDIAVGAPLNSAPMNSTTKVATNSAVAARKNPAHGQPGHRCDIAVGADLNSTQAKTTTPIIASNNTTTNSTSKNNISTGINPAHGQPGHRCDIAVGASLNSQAKPTATTPGNLNPSVFPNYNFPKKDSATSDTAILIR